MCYPGSRLDVNTADFKVEEVENSIITTIVNPTNLLEDIYGGDDQTFEHSNSSFVKVSSHRHA